MIISHSRKFIFIHLEKCGGTSVESALQPYLAWDDIIFGSTEFGESIQSLYMKRYGRDNVKNNMLWKHSDASQIYSYIGSNRWNDYRKICVVRNPVDLMKSFYAFSGTSMKYHVGLFNKNLWQRMLDTNEFIDSWPFYEDYMKAYARSKIENSGIDGFIKHFIDYKGQSSQTQVSRMIPSLSFKEFDLVVDLLKLNSDWSKITDAAGIKNAPAIQVLNKSEYLEDVEIKDKTNRLIKKHFAADYEFLPQLTGVSWE